MKNAKNLSSAMTLIGRGLIIIALGILLVLPCRAQQNSAANSPNSDTPANKNFRRAAAEAIEELRSARRLITAQEDLIEALEKLIQIEREISTRLKEINSSSAAEREQLRLALVAKDKQIEAQGQENKILAKRNRGGVWRGVRNGVVTAAAGILLGKLF